MNINITIINSTFQDSIAREGFRKNLYLGGIIVGARMNLNIIDCVVTESKHELP